MVKLHVRIIEAKDLLSTNSFSKGSDPYCELMIKNKFPPQRTRVLKKTCDPKWNEEFVVFPDDLKKDVLILTINGFQSLGDHSPLGQVQLVLSSLLSNPIQDVWIPLQPREGTTRKVKGEIHIQLRVDGASVPTTTVTAVYGMPVPPPGAYMAPPPGMYYPPPSGYPPPTGYPAGYAPPGSGNPAAPASGYPAYTSAPPVTTGGSDPNAAYYSGMGQGYGGAPLSGAPPTGSAHGTQAAAGAGQAGTVVAGYNPYTYTGPTYGAPQGYATPAEGSSTTAYSGASTTTASPGATSTNNSYSTSGYAATTQGTTTGTPAYSAPAGTTADPYTNYTSYTAQPSAQPQASSLYPTSTYEGSSK